ncbi:MAG: tetratricopeptide repeat protein [Aquabacterium sp.]|nr:MAG: tetratricopeptide repeat protein [Aquabacterium sp.]
MSNAHPDPGEKESDRALFMLGNGRAEEASATIARVLLAHPESPSAHRAMAMILVHRADFHEAEKSLLLAIRYSPMVNHSCYSELGEVLIQLGRTEEAVEKLSVAIESMNAIGDTWELSSASFARAFANFKLGNFEDALRDLEFVDEGFFYYGDELWNKSRVLKEISIFSKNRG